MKFAAITFLLCFGCSCIADQALAPVPKLFVSDGNGNFVFSMVPGKRDTKGNESAPPYGIVYKQSDDGTLSKFYRTSNWYSHEVFVSWDGRYLVQMGPWNIGQRPHKDDLAFAIHREGQLVRSFSTAELVVDHDKVKASASHYEWLSTDITPCFVGQYQFTLRTIDNWTYEFDLPTGKVLSKKQSNQP